MKIQKKYYGIGSLLLLMFFIAGQAKAEKSFLWKVESKKGTVYLLGSVHVAKKELYPLANTIEKAFDDSDYLVVEMNPDSVNALKLAKMSVLEQGKKLKDLLSPALYDSIASRFEKHSFNSMFFDQLKPWAAAMTLVQLELKNEGYDASYGIDNYFLGKAFEKKPILELESFDFQVGLFEKLNDKADDLVRYLLQDVDKTNEMVDEIITAWKKGDSEAINKLINENIGDMPGVDIENELLIERNKQMTKKIKSYLKKKNKYFVVVGAAHLVGETGIIKQLSGSKQYKITQL